MITQNRRSVKCESDMIYVKLSPIDMQTISIPEELLKN